jgi:2'-5' RNA ligase
MASPENILLHLAEDEEEQVREVFAHLQEQGFPNQQQRPHVTITFAPVMEDHVVQRAAQLLPPLIPATFRREGTVVFGTRRKQTVAWLLETSDELEIAAREISALNPAGRGPRWIPHLTVGLRLPREIVPEYIRALEELVSGKFRELTAVRAAHWRPQSQQITVLADENLTTPAEFPASTGLREHRN